ncbi:MAG: CPBP family intramembrane glutamic endopeptidase [Planctomycetota bacterium]|jgi:membrane protease YdiL (CAAX protease family)
MQESRAEYFERTKDFWNSILLVLPVMIFYQISLIPVARVNGVDFIYNLIAYFFHKSPYAIWIYVGFTSLLILLMIVLAVVFRHKRNFKWEYLTPLIAECALYAVMLGVIAVIVTRWVIEASPKMAAAPAVEGPFTILVISAGAGVYEEMVFRLFIFGGLLFLLTTKAEIGKAVAIPVCVIVSSALFSLAHYLGTEPIALASFTFRFIAGVIFCILFAARGFAAAVYTHTIYDIVVLSLSPSA